MPGANGSPAATTSERPKNYMHPVPAVGEGWTEQQSPELFQFERPGQDVNGLLIDVSTVELRGKKVPQYTFQRSDGRMFKLLGTYDIVSKLTATRKFVGCLVYILYRGDDQEVKKGDNAMKVFHVATKRLEQREEIPFAASDQDIPF